MLVERYGRFTRKERLFFENERSYFGKDADKYAKQASLCNNHAELMLYSSWIVRKMRSAGYEKSAYCIKMIAQWLETYSSENISEVDKTL